MKITIESTEQITTIDGAPVRVWEGTTERNVKCHVYVSRIGFMLPDDPSETNYDEFRQLIETPPPVEITNCLSLFELDGSDQRVKLDTLQFGKAPEIVHLARSSATLCQLQLFGDDAGWSRGGGVSGGGLQIKACERCVRSALEFTGVIVELVGGEPFAGLVRDAMSRLAAEPKTTS